MRQRWFWANWSFATAERAARRLGDVRLLCRALERVSAVQIERHRLIFDAGSGGQGQRIDNRVSHFDEILSATFNLLFSPQQQRYFL